MEANRRAVKHQLNAQNANNADKSDPVTTTPKAVVCKASNKSCRHSTRPDAEARKVDAPDYVPIPKPPPPTPDCTPAQQTKLMKQMQDYMNQQANLVYGGTPLKTPPPAFVRRKPNAKGDPSVHPQLVNRGVDAQTQTSFEQTRFPFELVTPQIFEESFGDISAAMRYSWDEMMFDDPSTMSRSPSSIADLITNFETSFPDPSRGDRGSLMLCCAVGVEKHFHAFIDVQALMQDITAKTILTEDHFSDMVL